MQKSAKRYHFAPKSIIIVALLFTLDWCEIVLSIGADKYLNLIFWYENGLYCVYLVRNKP